MQDLFRFLTHDDVKFLGEKAKRVVYEPQQRVLAEGSRRQALFVLRAGRVRVEKAFRGADVPVAALEAGEVFGEMSFVDNNPASASIVAVERSEADVIESADLHSLMGSVPGFSSRFYHSLAATLSERLRATTMQVILPFNGG